MDESYIVLHRCQIRAARQRASRGCRPLESLLPDNNPPVASLVELSSPIVPLETVKVSEGGQALVLRLFGVSSHDESVNLNWTRLKPASTWLCDLTEKPLKPVTGLVAVPAYEIVSLRVNLK